MRRQQWALYAVALAIVAVGLLAVGVPAFTLLIVALVLACPLMMIFMHGGHGHGHDRGISGDVDRQGTPDPRHDHHNHERL